MKLLYILTTVIAVHAGVIKEECNGVTMNNTYYDKELLHTDLDRPYLLAVDYSTNNLYFSYTLKGETDNKFKTARINLNTQEFNDIDDVKNGFAQAVDQENHDIYIGTDNGIYKYNYGKNKAELFGANGVDIWNLFYKDVLYYSTYPEEFLYTLVNGESVRFYELEDTMVDNFVIDNDNVIFFNNATGLYGQNKGTKDSVLYKEVETMNEIKSLTVDMNGKVYACLEEGLFVVNKESTSLDKVLDIDNCFGTTFDNDNNFVYADVNSVYRLKPNNRKKNCVS